MDPQETAFPRGSKPRSTGVSNNAGGQHVSKKNNPSRKRPAVEEAAASKHAPDILFGRHAAEEHAAQQEQRRNQKRRRKSSSTSTSPSSSSLLPIGGGGVVASSSKNHSLTIEALSFGKLFKGTKLLGVIREVQEEYSVVSLPNLLTGYILKRDNDPIPLTHTVSVGQVMSVVIVKTAVETIPDRNRNHLNKPSSLTRRRIQVSALPGSVNSSGSVVAGSSVRGRVQSIEDHGCLVDLGNGRKGFLPFSEIEGGYAIGENVSSNQRQIQVGRLFDFILPSDKDSESAPIPSLSLSSIANLARRKVQVERSQKLTLATLYPGMLVQAKVEAMARNGLCVAFHNGTFRGSIEQVHMGGYFVPTSKQNAVAQMQADLFLHKTLPARIIAVDVTAKVIRLSLQPHLLNLEVSRGADLPPVGTVVDDATVVRLDPGVGALLALPASENQAMDHTNENGDEDIEDSVSMLWPPLSRNESYIQATKVRAAYLHISKATDGRTAESVFAKDFALSTKHQLRILSTSHWLEGVASCATAKSIVEAHVLTHADLIPGKVYRQLPVCGQLNGGSVLVDFGCGVRGLIPQAQLFDQSLASDYRSRLRKEKYAVGAKVDVRCLSVDLATRKCLVTAKKSLLKAADAVTRYEGLVKGQQVTGYISRMTDRSLYVTFYNRVYGRVTARSLAAELGIEDHREHYSVGDVVKCRVIDCRRRGDKTNTAYDDDDNVEDDVAEDGGKHWELNLSLNCHLGNDQDGEADDLHAFSQEGHVDLHSGAILPSKCMKVVELVPSKEKKTGGFIPGHAIVSIRAKYILRADESSFLPFVECKLPFDQLMDSYSSDVIVSANALDALAKTVLTVGKKIHQRGLVLADPKKSEEEYSSGLGRLPIVSLRARLIATAAALTSDKNSHEAVLLPSNDTHLFMGAYVQGYVTQVNPRHGSFVRFLDKLTGLVPKLKSGLSLPKYGTVTCRVVALDVSTTPMKILLKPASSVPKTESPSGMAKSTAPPEIRQGDTVGDVQVISCNASRVRVKLLDRKFGGCANRIRARVHVTMSKCPPFHVKHGRPKNYTNVGISQEHPFHRWKKGTRVSGLVCAAVDVREGVVFVELTNRGESSEEGDNSRQPPLFIKSVTELKPLMKVPAFVTGVSKSNSGLNVELSPGVSGFIPGLEVCSDPRVLNNLKGYYPLGVRIDCYAIDEKLWRKRRGRRDQPSDDQTTSNDILYLSALPRGPSPPREKEKPIRGDLMIGRINHGTQQHRAPALMVDLRSGFMGRCCITELEEMDDWSNMPLGRPKVKSSSAPEAIHDKAVVTDEDELDRMDIDGESKNDGNVNSDTEEDIISVGKGAYAHGTYVQCRVLAGIPSQPLVEVSLRASRLEGDLDDDELPQVKEIVHGYVIDTNKKGCFLRLSRCVEGRATLKDLCDGFLPDPASSFPMGRLVVGKVKHLHEQKTSSKKKKNAKDFVKVTVDLDMRESTLLESRDKILFDDVAVGSKHKATVTRLESYGVFVRLENSDVSGLAHKSECSDDYIRNLADLYDPGDLVKVLVVKKDPERKTIGFSLKASHFEDDVDSDDDSSVDDESSDIEEDMVDALVSDGDNEKDDNLDSYDDGLVSKIAKETGTASDESSSKSEGNVSGGSSSDESDDSENGEKASAIDTNVGFDWGSADTDGVDGDGTSDEDSDDSSASSHDSNNEENLHRLGKTSHKSRKRAAARRQEELDISRRETALADGTADENPETAADFERLLASEPNRSEHWIRYMAYHLSLADVASARSVAQRAFDRIEFRQEGEKLNVWTALLTLELKYGSPKSLQETADRACQHNNPKQIYLRLCELLEKEVDCSGSSPEAIARADEMHEKMCRKFKGKKTVWISHLHYLLKGGRHKDAHALVKRALTSLPDYKHVETMSKFAQLEMEHGNMERGRTIMDGMLAKYPKRLDLLFVYVDKEVKAGNIKAARTLLEGASERRKLSDKQMKSLFKKWFRMEQEHGTDESREHVKDAARAYVSKA